MLRWGYSNQCGAALGFDDESSDHLNAGVNVQRRNSKSGLNAPRVRNTVGGRSASVRVLMDQLNGMIVVYEQDSLPSEAGPRTLIFEGQSSILRLESFPAAWKRMEDEALLALRIPHA